MQNEDTIYRIFIMFFLIVCLVTCRSGPANPGDGSLDESRIIAAVNAERNRWITGLSQQLTDGFNEIEGRINSVEGGLQQVAVAAREYRGFVLDLIDRVQQLESQIPGNLQENGSIDNSVGYLDSSENSKDYSRD